MTFLAPLWLALAVLAGVVLWLHARRRRLIAMASVRLWLLLDAPAARRAPLRWPPWTLLLLLHLAILLLAVMALAQPRLTAGPIPAEHTIFVLDTSASMRGGDADSAPLATARAELRRRIAEALAAPGRRVSLVTAGAPAELVFARQRGVQAVDAALQDLHATDGPAAWDAARTLLESLIRTGETTAVVVFSDGQDAAANALLRTRAGIERVVLAPGDAEDDAMLSATLTPVDAAAEGSSAPHFFLLETASRRVRVLWVGPQDPAAIRALNALHDVDIAFADQLPAQDGDFDLVVVHDVVVPRQPNTNVLWIARGRLAADVPPGPLTAGTVTAWRVDHPLARDAGWWSLETPWFYPRPADPADIVLAQAGDWPLLAARTTAQGRDVRLTLDPAASGWDTDPGYALLLAAVVSWLDVERGAVAPSVCIVGRVCLLEARESAARIVSATGEVQLPALAGDGARLPDEANARFVPSAAGLFRVERDGGSRLLAVHASPDPRLAAPIAATALPSGPPPPGRMWWWLAWGVGALLLLEGAIAGLGSERFLVARALAFRVPHAPRRRALLALRLLALAAIAASLLAAPVPRRETTVAQVMVVGGDLWAAMDDAARKVLFAHAAPGAAWIVASQKPQLLRDLGLSTRIRPPSSASPTAVDIEAALRLAAALLPRDVPGEILLATAGYETRGTAAHVLDELTRRGIAVRVLPLPRQPSADLAVIRVEVPPRAYAGDSLLVQAFVYSDAPTTATVGMVRGGEAALTRDVPLLPGINRIEWVLDAPAAGRQYLEVFVDGPQNARPGNDRAGAVVAIEPIPRVLVIAPEIEWARQFADALRVHGWFPDAVLPTYAPQAPAAWLAYDTIVLMNMPAWALTIAQQEDLADAVRIHGRGLLILGGEWAFGPDGDSATPLEDLSPLSARLPPVDGYIHTTLKAGADLHPGSSDAYGEPLPTLATWRQGSGRVLALATQGAGLWMNAWMAMPEYPLFWSQWLRQFAPETAEPGLHARFERDGDRTLIFATLLDEQRNPLDGRSVTAQIVAIPGVEPIELAAIGSGLYRGELYSPLAGPIAVAVRSGALHDELWIPLHYPAVLDPSQADLAALGALAAVTGGSLRDPRAEAAAPPQRWIWTAQWRVWIAIALLLFLADLLLRYGDGLLGVHPRRFLRAASAMRSKVGAPAPVRAPG